jgi:hypothetical protein
MRQNPPPASTKLREKMRELVPKRAIDLRISVITESRI